ncbi:MAG: hypothetical protein FWE29_04890 [Defluviitaleaceae bacterium]|nr:hypothetical protein [Defluviitaleaceae bacterium]
MAISQRYRVLPSEIIGISGCYEAFCFNEACLYIINELSTGKEILMDRQGEDLVTFLQKWEGGNKWL